MTFKIVSELPFGVKPIAPEEFAGNRPTVLLELQKPLLMSVDNQTIVAFPAGLVEVPTEPANVLIAAGARVYGFSFPEPVKVQMRPPTQFRRAGY
jgi:hypothetical protein